MWGLGPLTYPGWGADARGFVAFAVAHPRAYLTGIAAKSERRLHHGKSVGPGANDALHVG